MRLTHPFSSCCSFCRSKFPSPFSSSSLSAQDSDKFWTSLPEKDRCRGYNLSSPFLWASRGWPPGARREQAKAECIQVHQLCIHDRRPVCSFSCILHLAQPRNDKKGVMYPVGSCTPSFAIRCTSVFCMCGVQSFAAFVYLLSVQQGTSLDVHCYAVIYCTTSAEKRPSGVRPSRQWHLWL